MKEPDTDITTLIARYLTGEIDAEQFKKLQTWINEKPGHRKWFTDYLLFYKKARRLGFIKSVDHEKAWSRIVHRVPEVSDSAKTRDRTHIPLYRSWIPYSAAAAVIAFMVIAYSVRTGLFDDSEKVVPGKAVVVAGSDRAVLTLEDGTEVPLEKGMAYTSDKVRSDGTRLMYRKNSVADTVSAFNYLTIPRGGQFFIQLADSTKVWLNSESRLKYPVAFEEGVSRVVELEYGEAFFDVSHSSHHKGAGFQVLHKGQKIKVLGTRFNIKAYRDEGHVYTTLETGKVAISYGSYNAVVLRPGQQADLVLSDQSIAIREVDVSAETAWVDGDFVFSHKSLEDIAKILSRWYDVKIVFAREHLRNVRFNGDLSRDQDLDEILTLIKNTGIINDYELKENQVILR